MSILIGLADVLHGAWRSWLCRAIERLRPNSGHDWLAGTHPPMCRHCGTYRGNLHQSGRWT